MTVGSPAEGHNVEQQEGMAELNALRSKMAEYETEISSLKAALEQSEEERDALSHAHKEALKRTTEAHEIQMGALDHTHKAHCGELQSRHESELESLRDSYVCMEAHETALRDAKSQCKSDLKALADEHARELADVKLRVGMEFDDTLASLRERVSELESECVRIEDERNAETERYETSLRRIAEMEKVRFHGLRNCHGTCVCARACVFRHGTGHDVSGDDSVLCVYRRRWKDERKSSKRSCARVSGWCPNFDARSRRTPRTLMLLRTRLWRCTGCDVRCIMS